MSILVALAVMGAAQAANVGEDSLFARFTDIAMPYIQCVEGGRENAITPAHGSNASWSDARAAYQKQYGADDTDCGFYETHEKLTNLLSERYSTIPQRRIGFIAHDALGDLRKTGFRLENIDKLTSNGLRFAPPPIRVPRQTPPTPSGRNDAQD